MSSDTTRALKWLAPVAIVGALGLAACGGGDPSDKVAVSNRAALLADAERYLDQQKIPLGGPLYTVEVHGFRAIDESGYDSPGSDEVFGYFESTRGYDARTSVYGDVDTGDFRLIPRQERCLAPQRILSERQPRNVLVAPGDRWDCGPSTPGVLAPIGLTLELWEDDPCGHFFPSCFDASSPEGIFDPADDLIGRVEVTYDSLELERRLRDVDDVLVDSFILGGACGHRPNGGCVTNWLDPTGPEYRLTINIRLVREAPVLTR